MTQLVWLTDIHLNFLNLEARKSFYAEIKALKCDGIIISGDIDEAPSIVCCLKEMEECLQQPIYFVLGNHDYYYGSIKEVREEMEKLLYLTPYLKWLPASAPHFFQERQVVLLGQDGFADARNGDYEHTKVQLNDSRLIRELSCEKGKKALFRKMRELADKDAADLKQKLDQVMMPTFPPKKVLIVMHVPPFVECCIYNGRISGADYLPFYSCKVMGDLLLETAKKYKDIEFLVLCGHTHGKTSYQPLPNLRIKVGGASYRYPEIQEIIKLEGKKKDE